MNYPVKLCCLFLSVILETIIAINTKLLEITSPNLTDNMKAFMARIIEENSHEKNGFLFMILNKVDPEYSDFAAKLLHQNNTVIILNLPKNPTVSSDLNPNYFKFALADPEVDASKTEEMFTNLKVSRARAVLIVTKPPIPLITNYILNSYSQVKGINFILAYEFEKRIEVFTFNPYLPSNEKIQNLTNTKGELFYEKTRDLHGSKIKCLMTYRDRTKIKRIKKNNHISYEGKDYWAIYTLITHLNGNVEIINMDNVLINPWFDSLNLSNTSYRKSLYLESRGISILIKSEQFAMDDGVVENLYPHTQNDLTSVAPKSSKIPMSRLMSMICTTGVWIMNFIITLILALVWLFIKKKFRSTEFEKIYFNILRVFITNNLSPFPKHYIERVLIFAYILGSFITNIFIQSKITSYMAIKKYYPEIDTIEELFSSDLPLYSLPTYIMDVKRKYAGTKFEKYADSLISLTSNEGLMDQMMYRADVEQMPVFLVEHDIAVFISRFTNFRKNGVQAYHLVKESIIPNFQSYKLIHNSPLVPILNKKLRRLEEGGFINLWAQRSVFNATIEGFLYPENYEEMHTANPISFDVIKFWIISIFLGYTLSIFVFVGEILSSKKPKKKIIFLK